LQPEQIPQARASVVPIAEELQEKIAIELDRLRHDLEQIGVSLCVDIELTQRHCEPLQRLDELGQRSFWLAKLLRANDPNEVVHDITLGSLARRLSE
jgi:hypothetical protein